MRKLKKRFWFEKFDCFSISGKDAKKFVNGVTTGNFIESKNQINKTCLLTPNGVMRSLLEIHIFDKNLDTIVLEGDINEVKNFFKHIIFPADDVFLSENFTINRFQEIDDINSWRIYQPIFFKNEDQEYEVFKKKANVLSSDDLKMWKITQAIPSINREINGKNNPLELGLTDLIDFKKGCYLGQETMSKIKNVSSLKQEIRVWKSLDKNFYLESSDKKLYTNSNKDNSVGQITTFYEQGSQRSGLAMIKRKYLKEGDYFFSEMFGQIKIDKSVGSKFL